MQLDSDNDDLIQLGFWDRLIATLGQLEGYKVDDHLKAHFHSVEIPDMFRNMPLRMIVEKSPKSWPSSLCLNLTMRSDFFRESDCDDFFKPLL